MDIIDRSVLAAHIVRYLAVTAREERLVNLDDVVESCRAPRADVRGCLSQLHLDGLVDVTTMTPTAAGFVFGLRLAKTELEPIHRLSRHAA